MPLRPSAITLALLATAFAALLAMSWQRWGHLLIDCGGSVDLAARLASGQVLYRDVLSLYGPVAPYATSVLMRVFGIHLDVVYGMGIALLLLGSSLWWSIVRRFLSEAETASGLVALWALLAVQPGLFNWILPNTPANTFGAVALLGVLATVTSDLHRPKSRKLVLASVLAAVAGLSKIEFGAAAVGTMVAIMAIRPGRGRSRRRALMLALVPGAGIVAMVAAALARTVPIDSLLFDNLLRLRTLEESVHAYRQTTSRMGAWMLPLELRWALLILPAQTLVAAAGLASTRHSIAGTIRALALLTLALAPFAMPMMAALPGRLWFVLPPTWLFSWSAVGWLLVAVVTIVGTRRLETPQSATLLMVAIASVLLSARWYLQPAWPSFFAPMAPVLLILVARLPARHLVPGRQHAAVAIVLSALAVVTAEASWRRRGEVPTIHTARGTMRSINAPAMRAVIDYVEQHTSVGAYVAVFPEERFINFFSGRPHPTRDPGTGPGWLADSADEARVVRELEDRTPELIVVSTRRYGEFGVGRFEDYAPGVMRWIRSRYEIVGRHGRFRIFAPRRHDRRPRDV